jgi:hopanoid biosynthesis associated RND transporter like protein HpnN
VRLFSKTPKAEMPLPNAKRGQANVAPSKAGGAAAHTDHSESLIGRGLVAWTRLCLKAPVTIVAVALITAAVAGVMTQQHLGYKVSRVDLLDPESEYNRLWIDYLTEFGEDDDAVIVVEGPSRTRVVDVLGEVSQELSQEGSLFHSVLHEVDLSEIRSKGLHYLQVKDLEAIDRFLAESEPILAGGWSYLRVGAMVGGLATRVVAGDRSAEGEPPMAALERYTEGLLTCLAAASSGASPSEMANCSPWPGMPGSLETLSDLSSQYLLAKDGTLGFALVRIKKSQGGFAGASEATDELRRLIDLVASRHADIEIGLTGLPVMEDDEMRSSQNSMVLASMLSLAAVAVVIVAGFGGVRHALLANGVLVIGMAWAFAWATVSVGHLNILSVTFAVTMIGVGIDYGTYYVGRYLALRRAGEDCEAALLGASGSVGPGILTGAITTSIAFFSAALTSFVGVSELGMIAGGGILLCAAAELLVLPATIALVDRSGWFPSVPEPVPVHRWLRPVMRYPRFAVLASVAAILLTASGIHDLNYDHNLLNMQPEGLESVELEKKLLTECDQSVWYALSIASSREELLAMKEQFEALPTVERVDQIASLLPGDEELKRPAIEQIRSRLADLPERPPQIPVDRIDALGETLAWAQAEAAKRPGGLRSAWHLEQSRDILRRMSPQDCSMVLAGFQQAAAGDLLTRMHALQAVSDPEPPRLEDLPPSLVDRFVSSSGKQLLKIYGRGDIWDFEALKKFVHEVRSVDPRVTGHPLQAYEASLEMKRSYEEAALYSAIVILIVLWFDFRNLTHSFLAVLPLVAGMLQTLGIMGLVGIPLNPANLIGIPLVFGIAVDYGVHIVHDYLERPGTYRISPSTANSVLVDALTTILGFGALMVASHRGLESLGRVLTLGVTSCTITSLVFLPAVLRMLPRRAAASEGLEVDDAADLGESEHHEDGGDDDSDDASSPMLLPISRAEASDGQVAA